ncbi:MAG: DUF4139 domain-containing protein [Myxococcota bacterium]|nr:DUF4139 domain-containing protein [Myxococcota bacterium]
MMMRGLVVSSARACLVAVLASAASWGACRKDKTPPHVAVDVPLRRVVLYRNGVGYFERAGKVAGGEIRFKVRKTQVGDFLASLTVVTPEGKPVEFVSFPIEKEKKDDDKPQPPPCWPAYPYPAVPGAACLGMPPAPPNGGDGEDEEEDVIDVVVTLRKGAPGDVVISYVVESPIWRPTYRIVLDDKTGKALLQGWAVVQNLSGEDWREVRLSVTEGTPLTFRADLARPFVPDRPMVTDRGDVVQAAVPASVSVSDDVRRLFALARHEAEDAAKTAMPGSEATLPDGEQFDGYGGLGVAGTGTGIGTGEGGEYFDNVARRMGGTRAARSAMVPRGASAADEPAAGPPLAQREARYPAQPTTPPPPPPPAPGLTASGAQASLALLALGSQEGGVTTYQATAPVTVRDHSSTMVAIFNSMVDAGDTLLYRPDPGVPASSSNPFRVVRFTNQAGVTIERGPVAIFAREAFLGQGLLAPLPMGATTSIPYALERAVSISVEPGSGMEEAKLVKIVRGVLTVQRYSLRKTKYVLQNVSDRAGKVYIQHSRWIGWELGALPSGSEEVDATTVIVPLEFPAMGKAEIELIERSPTKQEVALSTDVGRDALRLYLSGPAVDEAVGPELRAAIEMRDRIGAIEADIERLGAERDEVSRAMSEVQGNVYAIWGIRRATALRERLLKRLSDLQKRYDTLQTTIIDLTAQRGELLVEMAEAIRDVTLEVPAERSGTS